MKRIGGLKPSSVRAVLLTIAVVVSASLGSAPGAGATSGNGPNTDPSTSPSKTLLPPAAAYQTPQSSTPGQPTPSVVEVGVTEKLGDHVALSELTFRDESGTPVSLSTFFRSPKPVLLSLVYFECPSLCSIVLNALLDSLKRLDWEPGKQFELVVLSIDPREGPKLAAQKRAAYLQAYGRPGAGEGWHFLTGDESQIRKLANQVGFGYKWDEAEKQYLHGAVFTVLTPEGKVSRYHYAMPVAATDLKLSLLEASNGKIGTILDRMVMFCYRYNPMTKRYSVALFRLMQGAAVLSTVIMLVFLGLFWTRQRLHGQLKDQTSG